MDIAWFNERKFEEKEQRIFRILSEPDPKTQFKVTLLSGDSIHINPGEEYRKLRARKAHPLPDTKKERAYTMYHDYEKDEGVHSYRIDHSFIPFCIVRRVGFAK
jgi:hypothetical protein